MRSEAIENNTGAQSGTARVSVIIPAYNAASFVVNAIESALAQTLRPHEIIVVDDASSDTTAEVVTRFAAPGSPVRLIRQKTNAGPGAARNAAIDEATGDWIAVLDADDRYFPDRLEYLVSAAKKNHLDLAADNYHQFDFHAGRIIGTGIPEPLIGDRLDLDRYTYVSHCMTALAGRVDLGLLKPIVRRAFLVKHGIRYREDVRHAEDFLFCLNCLVKGARFSVFPAPLYVYTQRFGSVSQKYSGLSRTATDYAAIESDARDLATKGFAASDPKLARLLIQRADMTRALTRFIHFRVSVIEKRYLYAGRLAVFDQHVRACLFRSIVNKCKARFGRLAGKVQRVGSEHRGSASAA